jgi:FAD/FMN-containing dehydrogenase
VYADGELVRVDAENEPELFWALRGGGGSFGIVTAVELALYAIQRLQAVSPKVDPDDFFRSNHPVRPPARRCERPHNNSPTDSVAQ